MWREASIPLLAVTLAVAAGCQSQRPAKPNPALLPMPGDDAPLADHTGEARSLAFNPESVPDPEMREYLPWYAARHDDAGPSVTVGVKTPALLYAETFTYDRQSIWSNGRVQDHVSTTTRRGRLLYGAQ